MYVAIFREVHNMHKNEIRISGIVRVIETKEYTIKCNTG